MEMRKPEQANSQDKILPDSVGAEEPVKPKWTPGRLGFIGRQLVKVAGVDPVLAAELADNEQREMKRVGLALIFGAAFQAACIFTGLTVLFGYRAWTLPLTALIASIMYLFDAKFVAADWKSQGEAMCRQNGLMPAEHGLRTARRPTAILLRAVISVFFVMTLAIAVSLKQFEADIDRHWNDVSRIQNAPLATAAAERYDQHLADLNKRVLAADDRLRVINRERTTALSDQSTADLDAQIINILDNIKALKAEKAKDEQRADAAVKNGISEKGGFRDHPSNTGLEGRGKRYGYFNEMATHESALAKGRVNDINTENEKLERLRRQRSDIVHASTTANRAYLESLDGRIEAEIKARADLATERLNLETKRESWIADRVREAPGYVPKPEGLVAKLQGLWIIMESSAAVAAVVWWSKFFVAFAEGAGPLAKVFFTSSGVYQMRLALRLHDEIEHEADRRLKWLHHRMATRERNHSAIDALKARRKLRETENNAREAVRKFSEKLSWRL